MLPLNNTISPHRGENILTAGVPLEHSKQAMILVHGRGASADSMLGLVDVLEAKGTAIIIPEASGLTWYPHRFIEKREANEPGISSGLALIAAIVNAVNEKGIATGHIFLLGFSQGACLAVEYAARFPQKFAGVFALSGGLIGDQLNAEEYSGDLQQTPVFFGCSDVDFHIPEQRVHQSAEIFTTLNADVTTRIYPDLGHTVNQDEIDFVNAILTGK